MIQPGKYRARAQAPSVSFGVSKNGNEQVAITFDLLDENDQPSGETIAWIGTFTEKTMARTLESVANCGWDMSTGTSQVDTVEANVVELVIEHEEYEGRDRARVKWINRLGRAFSFETPLDQRAKAGLFARIKAHQQGKPATGATAPQRAAQRPAPRQQAQADDPGGDEDIPW